MTYLVCTAMGTNCNSCQRAIYIQLDSSNYCMFAHLFSLLGIEEQLAPVVKDEIRPLLDLYVHLNGSALGHLIDFQFMA